MPEVHTSPRDPRMSLGPREASASGEKLGGRPQVLGPLGWMLRVGASSSGGNGCGEEGLTWTKMEGEGVRQKYHGSFVASSFQISETSGGHPRSSPQRGVTPEETKAHPCQPRAPPHLCSSPRTGSLCSQARGPTTADRAPTGVAPTATLPPLGHSGKAALGPPCVSRAGGCLSPLPRSEREGVSSGWGCLMGGAVSLLRAGGVG